MESIHPPPPSVLCGDSGVGEEGVDPEQGLVYMTVNHIYIYIGQIIIRTIIEQYLKSRYELN